MMEQEFWLVENAMPQEHTYSLALVSMQVPSKQLFFPQDNGY